MTFDKTLIMGFASGVILGCIGYKFIHENRDIIEKRFNLKKDHAEASPDSGLTLEELESQKERLEDLIAEVKARETEQE